MLALLLTTALSYAAIKDLPEVHQVPGGLVSVPGSNHKLAIRTDGSSESLLPQRFRIAIEQDAQVIVDRIYVKAFAAASVRRSLCFLGAQEATDMSHFLGVSTKAAREIHKICGRSPLTPQQTHALGAMKALFVPGEWKQPAKKFAFAFVTGSPPQIEGFTWKSGTTMVAVHEDEANDNHLLRILLHEAAVSFDQLGEIISPYESDSWESGLEMIFPGTRAGEIFEEPANLKSLRCALRDPAIRYAVITERAIRFEDEALADLGLLNESPRLASSDTCARTIGIRALQINTISPALGFEAEGALYDECGVSVLRDARRRETLVSRIRQVAGVELRFKSSGKILPLCDLLLNPHVGPRVPRNIRHGGPRPRINGW